MFFIFGYISGMIFTLFLVFSVGFLYFRKQQPVDRFISQAMSRAQPKGDFIHTPTDTEIQRKDKIENLSKIKSEIRLSEILSEDIL